MEEIYRQLRFVLYGMWQRRWYGVVVAWVLSLVGWGVVATLPDQYESYARIYVDADPMLRPLMKGISVDSDVMGQIRIMQQTLTSRPNLAKVVRMTDLDLTVEDEGEMEDLLNRLKSDITVRSQGGSLVHVSYENTDPQLAKRVVQALMTIFVETNLGRNRKDLAGAKRFIDEQLKEYESELDAAEAKLADFRRKNMGFLPGEQNFFEQMKAVAERYKAAGDNLNELVIRRDELQRQLTSVPQYLKVTTPLGPPVGPSAGLPWQTTRGGDAAAAPVAGGVRQRIQTLEGQMAALRLRFTDQHPDVARIKRELDALRQSATNGLGSGGAQAGPNIASNAAGPANTTISNPVFEQTKLDIIQLETDIKVMMLKVAALKKEVDRLNGLAKSVPVVDAEMTRLNRDYGVIKENYEEMLSRREKARIEQNIETKSDKVIYNLVEPPQVPIKPSGPDRPLYLTMVLFLGLGGGIGLAFVLSQISATFATIQSLRDNFALPVLGSVTALVTEPQRRRRLLDYSMFAVTLVGLLLAYGGVIGLELYQQT